MMIQLRCPICNDPISGDTKALKQEFMRIHFKANHETFDILAYLTLRNE